VNVIADIWSLLDRKQRRQLLLLQALAMAMGVFTLLGIASAVPFFAALGDPGLVEHHAGLSWLYGKLGLHDRRNFISILGVGFLCIVLLSNAANLVGALAMNRFAHRVGNDLAVMLFDDYLHREYLFHVSTNSATLLNNVVWEASRGITGVLQSLGILSTNVVTSTVIIVSVLLLNPLIAAGLAAVLGGSYAAIFLLLRRRLLHNGLQESRHTEERTRIANESFRAIKEITLVQGEDLFRGRFERSCRAISRTAANTQAIAQSPRYILESMAIGGLVVVALLLISPNAQNSAWLAQLAFLGFAAYRLLPALQQVFHSLVKIRADRVAFDRIARDLHHARSLRERSRLVANSFWEGRPHHDIRLNAVSFRYLADRLPAIQESTLRISAGSSVCFVGPNGSGKTTLAHLILGLLTPSSGTIEVDGVAIDGANRRDWQSSIAFVPQDIFLLDSSVTANIAFGIAPDKVNAERLRWAASTAHVDRFISALPRGYDETLGENGVHLSGGQRQRIGIARALYRNASLLVMDEATNALDGPTEREIMAMLGEFRGRVTTILIAHRLSTARQCDLIVALENGRITDTGTYDELLRRCEQFRQMASAIDELAITQ
jgi:ATP-binding cassette, subfamily B, bacterial PglK